MSSKRPRNRLIRDLATLLFIACLFVTVNFLPPDTAFAQVQRAGILRVCVPQSYPPLVTGNSEVPGIDIEILQRVADQLGVQLHLNTNSAIGRDFNPRSWRVNRAQCQVIAGGVVATVTTRSFLETTGAHLETGWALVVPSTLDTLAGASIGFYSGISGLERIPLSRFLRDQGAQVVAVSSADELAARLSNGELDAGVSEALTVRQLAGENNWRALWLPLERYPLAFGLWRGDLTLKRAFDKAFVELEQRGALSAIIERYNIAPIESTCSIC